MDKQKSHCALQDFVPFGAAAQKHTFEMSPVYFGVEGRVEGGCMPLPTRPRQYCYLALLVFVFGDVSSVIWQSWLNAFLSQYHEKK